MKNQEIQEIVVIKKKKNSWFDRFFMILALIITIGAVYYVWNVSSQGAEPFIFGYRPYIITSGSMEPYLKVNSLIIIKRNNFEDAKKEDIISFKMQNVNVCHQVIDISAQGLVTKGINNFYKDAVPVKKEQYVGKLVFKSNTVANYINFLNKKGFLLAVVFPLSGILFLICAFSFLWRRKTKVVKITKTIKTNSNPKDSEIKVKKSNNEDDKYGESDTND